MSRAHNMVAGVTPPRDAQGVLYSEHPLEPRAAPQRRLTPRRRAARELVRPERRKISVLGQHERQVLPPRGRLRG